MTQNRTHTCGELRLSDAGKQVKICGWLENVREVGQRTGLRRDPGFLRNDSDGGGDRPAGAQLKSINQGIHRLG